MMNDNKKRPKTVKIEFTQEYVDEFNELYLKKHPRAKKKPIQYPDHPSLNIWTILPRISMNSLADKWHQFTAFVVDKHNIEDLGISKAECRVIITHPTKASFDLSNYSIKFAEDGLVLKGVLVDDNYNYVTKMTIEGRYEKGVRKMEIIYENCEYDVELMKIEKAKREEKLKKKKEKDKLLREEKKNKKKRNTTIKKSMSKKAMNKKK